MHDDDDDDDDDDDTRCMMMIMMLMMYSCLDTGEFFITYFTGRFLESHVF